MRLMEFQRRFICAIYDNPAGTTRAYLSIARKNGKSALIGVGSNQGPATSDSSPCPRSRYEFG
jgi:phage terminase large subunit-like protein